MTPFQHRLKGHLAMLAVVAVACITLVATARPATADGTATAKRVAGVSKAVHYRKGLMGKIACKRKVIPCENGRPINPPCLVSSPLSNRIGAEWELSAYNRKLKRIVTERAVQVDVSHPKHRGWQMSDGRLMETDYYCMKRLVGGHYAPWEATVWFRQIGVN